MADRRLELAGTLAILLAGSAVWILRAPDSPAAVRLARWPGFGPVVEALRERGRRALAEPPSQSPAPRARTIRIEIAAPPEPPVDPGREPPGGSAGTPRAERAAPREIDRSVEPAVPLPARAADPGRLGRAAELLGPEARETTLGPYRFLGDFDPPERWAAIAAALDAAYAERTGLAPLGAPAETIVAISDPAAYRGLQRLEPRLAGLDVGGHAIAGLAAVRVELDRPDVTESRLVHELVHLVTRRAVGPALPPWLEEGLAEDLAQTPWDPGAAGFRTGALRGSIRRDGARIEIAGALAGLDLLVETMRRGGMPALAELLAMDWERFVDERGGERYAQSLAWVRFLLDGGDPARAAGFRAYLAAVARGGDVGAGALEAELGETLDALEAPFRAWLERRERELVDAAVRELAGPGETVAPRRPQPSDSSSRQADEPSS